MAGNKEKIEEKPAPSQNLNVNGSQHVSIAQILKTYILNIPRWLGLGLILSIAVVGIGIWYIVWSTQIFQPPMGGGMNILIVPFVEKNFGIYSQSDLGWNIAQTFSENLSASEQANNANQKFRILGPKDKAPAIWGFSENNLELSAQTLSERLNAQIVIYGIVSLDDYSDHLVSVRFFISPTNFGDAQELIGGSLLGEMEIGAFRIVGNTVSGDDLQAQNKELRDRVQVFSFIIKGLGAFIGQDFDLATNYFEQATDPLLWSNPSGLEVVYLLSGNVALRHSREFLDGKKLDEANKIADHATSLFKQALQISIASGKGTYARSFLGLAGVEHYFAIVNARSQNNVKLIDALALQREEEYLQKALAADYRPDSADIQEKVNYNRAQIALAHYQLDPQQIYLKNAKLNYQAVVDAFNKGNKRLNELAALSYSGLANVARIQGDFETAVNQYSASFGTTRVPSLKAQVLVNIGRIYDSQGNVEKALKYYQDALMRKTELQKVLSIQDISVIENRIQQLRNRGKP